MGIKRTNADIVMDAVTDLHNLEQIVTRETLAETTGLKLTVVDDRVSYLIDHGLVVRRQRGVFVPATQHPPARLISKTTLPDGTVSIEIGDDHVLTLTPKEARQLASDLAGQHQQFAAIWMGKENEQDIATLFLELRQAKRDIKALKHALSNKPGAQLGLAYAEAEGTVDA